MSSDAVELIDEIVRLETELWRLRRALSSIKYAAGIATERVGCGKSGCLFIDPIWDDYGQCLCSLRHGIMGALGVLYRTCVK